jgi:hypothetical protein
MRDLFGTAPRFESDECFLPLQAADFWAWWVRRGYEDGKLGMYSQGEFGTWRGHKHIVHLGISLSEDDIVRNTIQTLKEDAALGMLINLYDENVRPRRNELPSVPRETRSSLLSRMRRILKQRT